MPASFSLLIKPSSADCNLRCAYCFYTEKTRLYPDRPAHRMNRETLRALIGKYMKLGFRECSFSWQGGEPLLMGVDFFREVFRLQAELGRSGQRVGNSFQTNGVLLSPEWTALFREYPVLVGLSLDGPPDLHDAWRRDAGDHATHEQVMKAAALMTRERVEFNTLTVVHQGNVARAAELYRWFRERGMVHQQYIPAILTPGQIGAGADYGITGSEYGRFLVDLFNAWHPSDVRKVSIRFFDAVLNRLVTGQAQYCELGDRCDAYLVVEYNGDVYPCDFYVEKEWKLGNVNSVEFAAMHNGKLHRRFAALKAPADPVCRDCPHLGLCMGGCIRHRDWTCARSDVRSALCEGLRFFFDETLPRFRELSEMVRAEARTRPQA